MPLSGKEMVRLYEKQEKESIPMHRELSTGTEHKLLKRLDVKK